MSAMAALPHAWAHLAARERRLVALALVVMAVGLVWVLGIAPAWATLRTAPERLTQLDAQLQSVQSLAAQAQELKGRTPLRRDEALRTVEASVQQRLAGTAQISSAGDNVTITLSGVAPQVLAQWLAQIRGAARVAVQQARLVRGPAGWGGSIVLRLPPA